MRRVLAMPLVIGALVALVGCGDDGDDPNGAADTAGGESVAEAVTVGGGEALLWGDGTFGVVLAHGSAFDAASWEDLATAIAALGATALAVEDTSPESIEAAVTYLRDDEGLDQITLLGGSSGADAILALAAEQPNLPDSLILLSPNRVVDGLGDEPKLFVASEGEPVADVSTELADTAPGDDDVALIVPGSAHAQNLFASDQADVVTDAILDRLRALAPT